MAHAVSPRRIRPHASGLALALPLLPAAPPGGAAQRLAPAQALQPEVTTATLAVTTLGGAVVQVTVESDGDLASATHQAPPAAGGDLVLLILRATTAYKGLGVPARDVRVRGGTW